MVAPCESRHLIGGSLWAEVLVVMVSCWFAAGLLVLSWCRCRAGPSGVVLGPGFPVVGCGGRGATVIMLVAVLYHCWGIGRCPTAVSTHIVRLCIQPRHHARPLHVQAFSAQNPVQLCPSFENHQDRTVVSPTRHQRPHSEIVAISVQVCFLSIRALIL